MYVMHKVMCSKCGKEVWVFGSEGVNYVCNEHFLPAAPGA